MISPLVKVHVLSKARESKIILPPNYELILESMKNVSFNKKEKIVYSWLFDGGSKTLNACALVPGLIIVNSEWAARLVLCGNDQTNQAYFFTIGHELTHKERDFISYKFFTKEKKFVNWVNEVHADFGAVTKMENGNRIQAIESIKYKRILKGIKDREHTSHPSWMLREEFITKYNFDKDLIRIIANRTGCINEKIISSISKYYSDIILD